MERWWNEGGVDMDNLTEVECGTLILALIKCHILGNAVDAELPVSLNKKNFGFPKMTEDEVNELVVKLDGLGKIAWLREGR
jgi:hypothetical protein